MERSGEQASVGILLVCLFVLKTRLMVSPTLECSGLGATHRSLELLVSGDPPAVLG